MNDSFYVILIIYKLFFDSLCVVNLFLIFGFAGINLHTRRYVVILVRMFFVTYKFCPSVRTYAGAFVVPVYE